MCLTVMIMMKKTYGNCCWSYCSLRVPIDPHTWGFMMMMIPLWWSFICKIYVDRVHMKIWKWQYPTDREKNICEAAVLQILKCRNVISFKNTIVLSWFSKACYHLEFPFNIIIISIFIISRKLSYIVIFKVGPFWSEELQDALSSALSNMFNLRNIKYILNPKFKHISNKKIGIYFGVRNSRIPWATKNGNCECADAGFNMMKMVVVRTFTLCLCLNDNDTHVPGGGIGQQSSEDEVGREGDEVGRLAQRLQTWESRWLRHNRMNWF